VPSSQSDRSLHTISKKSKKIGGGNTLSNRKKIEQKMRAASKMDGAVSECSWSGASTSRKSS